MTCICLYICVAVSHDLYVSVCLCDMTCMCLYVCVSVSHDLYVSVCLYVCVIGNITYLQPTLLAANFITDSRYFLTTLLTGK